MMNLRSLYGPNQPAATLLAAPTSVPTPTASGTGTAVTNSQKWFVLTFVNAAGETVGSATVTVTPAAGATITTTSPAWPANMAITKTNVYEGTAPGGPYYLQGAITASGGTLAITTEPNAANAQPPSLGSAYQPVLIGTVGAASGFGSTTWLPTWTDVFVKSIILGNQDSVNKGRIGVFLVRSGGSPGPSNLIVPGMQVDVTGDANKSPLQVIPFSNLDMQTGDALWAVQYQASPPLILTIEGSAKP